jgi:acyl-CoA synthetase (AMP-forming)/AMP-acid ligase II
MASATDVPSEDLGLRSIKPPASRVAAGLHAHGVAKGEHVGVLARNSHGFTALRFALARLGAVLVPINFMLNADDAGVHLLGVDSELADLGQQAAQRDTQVTRFLWLPSEADSTRPAHCLDFHALAATDLQAQPCPEPEFDRHHLLQIVYTSGTESLPKGAMLTHGAVIDQYVSCIKPEDQLRKPGSAGRPALNVETRVVDERMNDVRPGEIGENVASREVEEALYRLAGVSEVAVIGVPHPRWIEAVTAVVVCKPEAQLDEAQVLAHCAAQLAHFKAPKAGQTEI